MIFLFTHLGKPQNKKNENFSGPATKREGGGGGEGRATKKKNPFFSVNTRAIK